MIESTLVKQATFNPKVKTYIFFIVLFYLVISVAGIVLVPFWLFGLGQWLSKKFFYTLKCQLTTKHLKFSKGIILHIEKTIPLENIQDLSFIGGPILRSFGLTMIKVETAGGGGAHQSNMMSMIGIDNSEEFKNLILAQREKIMKEKNMVESPAACMSSEKTDSILIEIKNELQQIRQIIEKKSV
ncbi:MAG: PH domain-containing protein [Bacteroidota bacterium]|jgi:putative membrane protein